MTEQVGVPCAGAVGELSAGVDFRAANPEEGDLEESSVREVPFLFTGTAGEYFRIWIVNTLLTLVTLGVFSAWAKVRTKQYFYRNTTLDGTAFDYHGDPIAILKGRIIVAAILGLIAWTHFYSPIAYLGTFLLLAVLTPWVVVRSLAFNAHNSSYRNIRFAFPARTGEAYAAYLKGVLIYVVSCGFGYPWFRWELTRFAVHRHYYGDLKFAWTTQMGTFYGVHFVAGLLAVPAYVALGLTRHAAGPALDAAVVVEWLPAIAFGALLLIPAAYLKAKLTNLLYGGMTVGEHWFESTQATGPMLKLYFINGLGIVLSLGLLTPWAKIRMAQYRASTLKLVALGSLRAESLLDDTTSALGEGMHDLGDFDLGIGT